MNAPREGAAERAEDLEPAPERAAHERWLHERGAAGEVRLRLELARALVRPRRHDHLVAAAEDGLEIVEVPAGIRQAHAHLVVARDDPERAHDVVGVLRPPLRDAALEDDRDGLLDAELRSFDSCRNNIPPPPTLQERRRVSRPDPC